MKIVIDGDGCPVIEEAVLISNQAGIECAIICDTAHKIEVEGAETIVVSKGADSVDFVLVNFIHKGDIVITQDFGLAAMCLAKGADVLNQDGMQYTKDNIDGLLLSRYMNQKIRRAGGRTKNKSKRNKNQDELFIKALKALVM